MNTLRRALGWVWILAGVVAAYYLIINQAVPKFSLGTVEEVIPAIIYAFILTPIISGGLFIFGKYAIQGEYDRVN